MEKTQNISGTQVGLLVLIQQFLNKGGKKVNAAEVHPDIAFLGPLLEEFTKKIILSRNSIHEIRQGVEDYGDVVKEFKIQSFDLEVGRVRTLADNAFRFKNESEELIKQTCRCLSVLLGIIRVFYANPKYARYVDPRKGNQNYREHFLEDINEIKLRLLLASKKIPLAEFAQYVVGMKGDLTDVQKKMLDEIAKRIG